MNVRGQFIYMIYDVDRDTPNVSILVIQSSIMIYDLEPDKLQVYVLVIVSWEHFVILAYFGCLKYNRNVKKKY